MSERVAMRIGPSHPDEWWDTHNRAGDCKQCGSDCGDDCGTHPAGCIFGGFSDGYWMIVEGCTRFHGEVDEQAPVQSLPA